MVGVELSEGMLFVMSIEDFCLEQLVDNRNLPK